MNTNHVEDPLLMDRHSVSLKDGPWAPDTSESDGEGIENIIDVIEVMTKVEHNLLKERGDFIHSKASKSNTNVVNKAAREARGKQELSDMEKLQRGTGENRGFVSSTVAPISHGQARGFGSSLNTRIQPPRNQGRIPTMPPVRSAASGLIPSIETASIGETAVGGARGKQELTDMEKLQREINSLVNKVTVEKFATICEKLAILCERFKSYEELELLVKLIYTKAVTEHPLSEVYADVCEVLSVRAPTFDKEEEQKKATFIRAIINTCQDEFDKLPPSLEAMSAVWKDLSPEERAFQVKKQKHKVLGNMIFIGHLYLRKLLLVKVIRGVVNQLARPSKGDDSVEDVFPEAHYVECLCTLVMTIGASLCTHPEGNGIIDQLFCRLRELINMNLYESRIRFIMQNVLDAKNAGWKAKQIQSLDRIKAEQQSDEAHGGAIILAQQGKFRTLGLRTHHPYQWYLDNQFNMKKKHNEELPLSSCREGDSDGEDTYDKTIVDDIVHLISTVEQDLAGVRDFEKKNNFVKSIVNKWEEYTSHVPKRHLQCLLTEVFTTCLTKDIGPLGYPTVVFILMKENVITWSSHVVHGYNKHFLGLLNQDCINANRDGIITFETVLSRVTLSLANVLNWGYSYCDVSELAWDTLGDYTPDVYSELLEGILVDNPEAVVVKPKTDLDIVFKFLKQLFDKVDISVEIEMVDKLVNVWGGDTQTHTFEQGKCIKFKVLQSFETFKHAVDLFRGVDLQKRVKEHCQSLQHNLRNIQSNMFTACIEDFTHQILGNEPKNTPLHNRRLQAFTLECTHLFVSSAYIYKEQYSLNILGELITTIGKFGCMSINTLRENFIIWAFEKVCFDLKLRTEVGELFSWAIKTKVLSKITVNARFGSNVPGRYRAHCNPYIAEALQKYTGL
eukprot:GHVR01063267.1.p1 GENE.GHVR01063267.1~~GHVR01063267.1.p1  ORF type:complete len:903 (+),score=185.40 GHVR01063267.1:150-2858(+)